MLSRNAILPNICAEESSQIKSASLPSMKGGKEEKKEEAMGQRAEEEGRDWTSREEG